MRGCGLIEALLGVLVVKLLGEIREICMNFVVGNFEGFKFFNLEEFFFSFETLVL